MSNMPRMNYVKVRIKSPKEAHQLLEYLFSHGHEWRGGSKHTHLSDYERESITGLYISDTDEDDCYQQQGAITFDTDAEAFWRDTEHFPMSLQGALSYYETIIPDKYDWSIKQDHPTK